MSKVRKTFRIIIVSMLIITLVVSGSITADAASYSGKYWVKVNEQCNVVTVYEKSGGKWKPIRGGNTQSFHRRRVLPASVHQGRGIL